MKQTFLHYQILGIVLIFNLIIYKTYSQIAFESYPSLLIQESRDNKGNRVVQRIIQMESDYLLIETREVTDAKTGFSQKISEAKVANQVIIQLREGQTQADLQALVARGEGKILKKIYGENAYVVSLNSLNFETLPKAITFFSAQNHIVKQVSENGVKFPNAYPNDPSFKDQWALDWKSGITGDWQWKNFSDADIDAPEAWEITKGSATVVVGVIDTGIDYNHPDLTANIWKNIKEIPGNGLDDEGNGLVDDVYGYNFWEDKPDPMDVHEHGTHVAGIIGASGNNGKGVAGVNWTVKLMALKCGNSKAIYTDAFLSAVNYAIAQGVKILNCSFAGPTYPETEKEALEKAKAAGILVICAAGNESRDNDTLPSYPASAPFDNIISVTGTDSYDEFYEDFNYGKTNVDLAAPGVAILSTISGGQYANKKGTSMATPLVAGVAALIQSKKPAWSYSKVKQEILESVDKKNSLQGKCVTGGRLNAFRALKNVTQGPVEFILTNYIADESVMIHSVIVRRYGGANAASVSYEVIADSAQTGDYVLNSGVLNFSAGQIEKPIVFFVNKNDGIEGKENFRIKLFNPQGMTLGLKKEMTVSIVDNDPGVIELVLPEFVAYESAEKITITAIRKGGSFGLASVQYGVSSPFEGPGFAKAGQDYLLLPGGSLSWKDGEQGTKSFTVTLIDDVTTELLEEANITLFNPKGSALNSKKTAKLLIEDNEPTKYFFNIYPGYETNAYEVTEGAKTFSVEVGRKGFRKKESVHFVTQEGTAKGEDIDYASYATDLLFTAKSESVWQITLGVVADQVVEGDEFYTLKLLPPSAQSVGSTAKVTIKNGSKAGVLKLQNEFTEITEDDATEFYIVRENGTDGAVSIDYKIEGTAQLNQDYEILNGLTKTGTVHFESGQKIAAVQFSILDDQIQEQDETITIQLFNPKNGAQLGMPSQGEIVIKGDNPSPGKIQFTSESFVTEEGAGQVLVTVSRTEGTSGPVTVKVATSDEFDALAEVDYTTVVTDLNWADGEGGSKAILIPIQDDALVEDDEQFAVFINSIMGAQTGFPDMTTVTIIDNEEK